eukprot:4641404-Prymnesium_polylepis.1
MEREAVLSFFKSHGWRVCDIADAVAEMGWVGVLLKTTPFALATYDSMQTLVKEIETEHYGIEFGLMLHYDQHLPVSKILAITQ